MYIAELYTTRLARLVECSYVKRATLGSTPSYDLYFSAIDLSNLYRPIHADLYRPIQTYTDLYRSIQTYTDLLRPIEIYTDLYRPIQTYTDLFRPIEIYTDLYRPITQNSELRNLFNIKHRD